MGSMPPRNNSTFYAKSYTKLGSSSNRRNKMLADPVTVEFHKHAIRAFFQTRSEARASYCEYVRGWADCHLNTAFDNDAFTQAWREMRDGELVRTGSGGRYYSLEQPVNA
jgi:hypothetical protein